MTTIQDLVNAIGQLVNAQNTLTQQLGQPQAQQQPQGQQQPGNNPAPTKIGVKIPTFKGEPHENIVAWLLQIQTIFLAQGLADEPTQVHYATTGLKNATLHWYLNRVVTNNNQPPFND